MSEDGLTVAIRYRAKAQEYRQQAAAADTYRSSDVFTRIASNLERLADAYEAYERSSTRNEPVPKPKRKPRRKQDAG